MVECACCKSLWTKCLPQKKGSNKQAFPSVLGVAKNERLDYLILTKRLWTFITLRPPSVVQFSPSSSSWHYLYPLLPLDIFYFLCVCPSSLYNRYFLSLNPPLPVRSLGAHRPLEHHQGLHRRHEGQVSAGGDGRGRPHRLRRGLLLRQGPQQAHPAEGTHPTPSSLLPTPTASTSSSSSSALPLLLSPPPPSTYSSLLLQGPPLTHKEQTRRQLSSDWCRCW